jgi:hypothetical protein
VQVLVAGEWRHGVGAVLLPGDDGYSRARSAYRTRWPRLTLPDRNPIVVVKFD